MSLENYKIKNGILILGLVFLFFVAGSNSRIDAQTNSQVLITWQAQNFVPAEYSGKILPSPGTNIKLGLELIKENKLQELSKINIRWYIDGKLSTQGLGLKETTFFVNKGVTYSHFVRAVIMGEQEVSGTVDIPITNPLVVIKSPSPDSNFISLGKNIFQAIPYFFNVTNLQKIIFDWSVNNQTIKGTNLLELELAPPIPLNQNINIKVSAQNLNNNLEFGTKEINLNVQQ